MLQPGSLFAGLIFDVNDDFWLLGFFLLLCGILHDLILGLIHVEHPLRNDEAAEHVDGGEEESDPREEGVDVQEGVLVLALRHGLHASHHDDSGNGVGHGHERRVQSRLHVPDHHVPDEDRQDENAELQHEFVRRVDSDDDREAQNHYRHQARCDQGEAVEFNYC